MRIEEVRGEVQNFTLKWSQIRHAGGRLPCLSPRASRSLHGTFCMEPARMQHCYTSQHTLHRLCTQCAAKTSKAAAMKSGRPHSIRRFAEADASNLLTVLVRSNLAANDNLLDELALRVLDIGELCFSLLVCATPLLTQDLCLCVRHHS